MSNDLIAIIQALADYAVLLSCQLVLVLIARKPVLRLFGAVHAYRLWLLPMLWAPLFFFDWSWFELTVAQTLVADTIIEAPVALVSPAMEWFSDGVSGALPTLQREVAGLAPGAAQIDWQLVLAGLWLAGVLTLLIRQGFALRFFYRHVRKYAIPVSEYERSVIAEQAAISTRVPLYSLAGLRTPALFGAIKPMLLVPADFMTAYDGDQRRLILAHESVHLRRGDNLWNLCAWSLKVIFWFNPLVHVAYRYFGVDQELSCDALALVHSDARQRKRYAKTLLEAFGRSGTHRQSPLLTAWSSLHTIKERTVMIKRYPQGKSHPALFRLSVLALVLSGAVVTTLMTMTLSSPTLAADAGTTAIPVDRAALSTAVIDATDRIATLVGAYEYDTAEAQLNELGSLELNEQERYLLARLTGDLALARGNATAALAAYSGIQDIPGLSEAQREDALLHRADALMAGGADYYKAALDIYRQLSDMAGGRNPDYLLKIASALHRLKQIDAALVAVQEAIALSEDDAPRSAYMLLWRLTQDLEAKRQVHETLVEKFRDPQDIGRLAYFTREDGSYDPGYLGSPFGPQFRSGSAATVTPDGIRFAPSSQPLEFVQPAYPLDALHQGVEGFTTLVIELDSDGKVINPVILNSIPDGTFDEATLAAISQFRADRSQLPPNATRFLYTISYELPAQE